MHRAAGNVQVGHLVVQEPRQQPHQPALGLPLLAQEQHVVLGDQGQVDLGDDRVLIADDAREQLVAPGQGRHEIVVNLLLDRLGTPAAGTQLADWWDVLV